MVLGEFRASNDYVMHTLMVNSNVNVVGFNITVKDKYL